jgi:regulator of replication initiation timing
MERSRQESARAEIEFVNRTAEYNFETLKGQIENLTSENGFFKMQNEKQKKSIDIMRATNERMAQDLEHYKKISLAQQARSNKAKTGATPLKPQEAPT